MAEASANTISSLADPASRPLAWRRSPGWRLLFRPTTTRYTSCPTAFPTVLSEHHASIGEAAAARGNNRTGRQSGKGIWHGVV